jgi:hypothetical protein
MPFQSSNIQEVGDISDRIAHAADAQAQPTWWNEGYLTDACVVMASRDWIDPLSGERVASQIILRDMSTRKVCILQIRWDSGEVQFRQTRPQMTQRWEGRAESWRAEYDGEDVSLAGRKMAQRRK